VACPEGGYDYIATGYDPFIPFSYVLFRLSQEVIAYNDAGNPTADPQSFSIFSDNVGGEFCANDSADTGSPALPNGVGAVYNLGSATEYHSNVGGTGTIKFVLTDEYSAFQVTILFTAFGLLNQTQMDNIPGPCDLIVSNFQSVTYTVEKPVGTVVQNGIISCFQFRSCNNKANLYGCQVNCLTANNGVGCTSFSPSSSILPSGVSRSASETPLQYVTTVSTSPTISFTSSNSLSASPSADVGGGGHPDLGPSSEGISLLSWLSLFN